MLNIKEALKCNLCGRYIIDYDDYSKDEKCCFKCLKIINSKEKIKRYQHNYYMAITKEKRRLKRLNMED